MTKLAPEWVRTSDPVIRSPARYRWTTAPARFPEWKTVHSPVVLVLYSSEIVSAQNLFLMVTIEVEKLPLLARYPPLYLSYSGKVDNCGLRFMVAIIRFQIDRGTVWHQIMWVAIPNIEIICHGSQIWVSFVE